MKKLILFIFVILSQNTYANGNIGGMDGGGGGTLPTHPVPTYRIREIVSESKQKLLYLFNEYERQLKFGISNSLLTKLFLGPRKVQEVLNDLRIEVRLDKPCLTSQGTEVDGSIYGIKPNTICLSAFRISQKIDISLAEREILALLTHEVSHFLGADETEATELQKDIAFNILNSPQGSEFDSENLRSTISESLNFIHHALNESQSHQFTQASESLLNMIKLWNSFRLSSSSPLYNVFNPMEEDYQYIMYLKIFWSYKYLKAQIVDSNQKNAIAEYNEPFADRDYFLMSDQTSSNNIYANERISKIKSVEELISVLKSLKREYEVRHSYIWQSTFGYNWLNLNGHLTKVSSNPWQNFIGEYKIQSSQCTSNSNSISELREFKIFNSEDSLIMSKISSHGLSNEPLELGGYNINSYLNDYGLLSSNKVYMIHEMGGSWSENSFINRTTSMTTLETFQDKSFKIIIEKTIEDRDITQPDSKNTCVLTGTFQN